MARRVIEGAGAPADLAKTVADSLVLSNLVGHDSHGIVRLDEYAGWIRERRLLPDARPSILASLGGTTHVSGSWGWGQPAALLAVERAGEAARQLGIGMAVVSDCNHIGRLGEWVEILAAQGMMAVAFCNTGSPVVAPFGASRPMLGTNPFAWALPGENGQALVLDFSTAIVAAGKVVLSALNGEQLPPGLLLDPNGLPTVDPHELFRGGALRAFGEHKGSGLAIMIELSAGLLTGVMPACLEAEQQGNGTIVIAADTGRFVSASDRRRIVSGFRAAMHSAAADRPGTEVLLPGDYEERTRDERSAGGIPVAFDVQRAVLAVAESFGVQVPEFC